MFSAAAQSPVFEVASVKPAQPGDKSNQMSGGPGSKTPDRISYRAVTLHTLLAKAYGVEKYQVSGPAWFDEQRYDIAAKVPHGSTREQLEAMLQALLADRLGLAAHRESRVLPVYALVVGKDGPKFKPTPKDPDPADKDGEGPNSVSLGKDGFPVMPRGFPGTAIGMMVAGKTLMRFRGETMAEFAKFLTSQTDRPVLDLTELADRYDFATSWEADRPAASSSSESGFLADPGPTVFQAVQVQLGLRLEPRKAPVDMVIVDQANRLPSEN